MKKLFATLVSLALISPSVWSADGSASPWYVGAGVGQNHVSDFSVKRELRVTGFAPFYEPYNAHMKNGEAYDFALGYRVNSNLSGELAYSRRTNSSDKLINATGGVIASNSLRLDSDSIMGNVIYTYDRFGAVRPYAGIGLGASKMIMKKHDTLGDASDSAWAFAYQAMLGAEVKMTEQWRLFAQYQYFKVDDAGLSATTSRSAAGNTTSNRWDISTYEAKTVSLGIRYGF